MNCTNADSNFSQSGENLTTGTVARIIDGDTIELVDGRTIRYLDIDTPETVHPTVPIECYGLEATARNVELVSGETVHLDIPADGQDRFGRTLAYVYTQSYFVNGELVFGGYVTARSFGTPGRLYSTLVQLEQSARSNERGLWGDCQSEGSGGITD